MLSVIFNNLLWTQGSTLVLWLIFAGGLAYIFCRPFAWIVGAAVLFSFYFFRNPERVCPAAVSDSRVIVCPADGRVVDVNRNYTGAQGYDQKISIFLSPFDVHVNWIPTPGTVTSVTYQPGAFMIAWLPKSSEANEHNDVVIERVDGDKVLVRQIAGTVARRIVCWVKPEDTVKSCEKFGMIRFGSRVDVLLPRHVKIALSTGQRVYGGQTVLGFWP